MAIKNAKQYLEVHRNLYKHLHFEGNGIEIILKGQLLIEEIMTKILEKTVVNTQPLKEANLTFHKSACLVQAIHDEKCKNWVWLATFQLNNIRNKLAHNLEYPNIDERIEEFTEFVRENGDGTMEFGDELGFEEVPMAIVNLHSNLWRLLDSLEA